MNLSSELLVLSEELVLLGCLLNNEFIDVLDNAGHMRLLFLEVVVQVAHHLQLPALLLILSLQQYHFMSDGVDLLAELTLLFVLGIYQGLVSLILLTEFLVLVVDVAALIGHG
jgi:hypothetical protein